MTDGGVRRVRITQVAVAIATAVLLAGPWPASDRAAAWWQFANRPAAAAELAGVDRPLRIATASVTGVYSALGAALCRLLEPDLVRRRQLCTTMASQGSVENLRLVRSHIADLGIAQGEVIAASVRQRGPFAADAPNPNVRLLFATLTDQLHVVVRGGVPAETAADLGGRRIDLGLAGSGTRYTAEELLAAAGLSADAFSTTGGSPAEARAEALCRGESDAFAFMGASPNGVIRDALARCDSRLVALSAGGLAAVAQDLPAYRISLIPADTYPGQAADVATLGTSVFVFADRRLPDAVAERVTEAAFTGLAELNRLHLAFREIDLAALLAPCPAIPYHPGALAYFARAGITSPACP